MHISGLIGGVEIGAGVDCNMRFVLQNTAHRVSRLCSLLDLLEQRRLHLRRTGLVTVVLLERSLDELNATLVPLLALQALLLVRQRAEAASSLRI